MCIHAEMETPEAKRLRRAGGIIAASSAALSAAPALNLTHGHPALGWTLLGIQLCMVTVAFVLLARSRRNSSSRKAAASS